MYHVDVCSVLCGSSPAANNCRHENCRLAATIRITCQQFTYFFCSQRWFATLQEVLLADWQDVWHSPQPAFFRSSLRFLVLIVLILFMLFLRILLRRAPLDDSFVRIVPQGAPNVQCAWQETHCSGADDPAREHRCELREHRCSRAIG
jgi:hypothetical protein